MAKSPSATYFVSDYILHMKKSALNSHPKGVICTFYEQIFHIFGVFLLVSNSRKLEAIIPLVGKGENSSLFTCY